jgi:hypothetical protein
MPASRLTDSRLPSARRRYTAEVDAVGTLNLLEAIRLAGLERTTRFYQARPRPRPRLRCDAMPSTKRALTAAPCCARAQASTSEMYGKVQEVPQRESTPFYPRSPCAFHTRTHSHETPPSRSRALMRSRSRSARTRAQTRAPS